MFMESTPPAQSGDVAFEPVIYGAVAWVQLECPSCATHDSVILEHPDHDDPLMRIIRPSARFRVTRLGSDLSGTLFGCIGCMIPAVKRSIRSESSTCAQALLTAYQARQSPPEDRV
jgi:hypothetical protein